MYIVRAAMSSEGLSPRVRGNPPARTGRSRGGGSIPACAGEPKARAASTRRSAVYPRVCGGTSASWAAAMGRRGLSPRVRGNPSARCLAPVRPGSIPACAGEPGSRAGVIDRGGVYPRVCGGTLIDATEPVYQAGLSPRVRGNHFLLWAVPGHCGSIPACAGEPGLTKLPATPATVYPRVCGGTT